MAQWETLEIALPDQIVDLAEIIDSFVQALLAVLDLALSILQVVKAFLIGFLDPLAALIEAIINEIEGFLEDIRQIGVYVSGDLEAKYPFHDLIGGFAGYERRMIGRLVDRTDPSRPAFSSRSTVVAIFLYSSFDETSVKQFIDFITKVMKFFGQRSEIKQFTVPVGLDVTYGRDGAPLSSFGSLMSRKLETSTEVPNVANVRWSMAPPPEAPSVSWPLPAPSGFLVEVSTVRDGLLLAYDATAPNAEREEDGNLTRTSGLVKHPSGKPFRLYGGYDQINIEGINSWAQAVASGSKAKDGSARVYAIRDTNSNVPIPLDQLKDGDRYLLQRTFYVSSKKGSNNPLLSSPGQGFSIQLAQEDMPYHADFTLKSNGEVQVDVENDPAQTVYVRVTAVSENVDREGAFQWAVSEQRVNSYAQSQRPVVIDVVDLSTQDRGDPSAPLVVTFPSTETKQYLQAVTAALAVLVLSRSDLPGFEDAVFEEYDSLAADIEEAEAAVTAARVELDRLEEHASLFATYSAKQAVIDQAGVLADQNRELATLRARRDNLLPFVQDTARKLTGLEGLAKYLIPRILGNNPSGYFKKAVTSPAAARADLLRRCRAVANEIYRQSGNMGSLEALVVEKGAVLIDEGSAFRWSDHDAAFPDQTILESLATSAAGCFDEAGIALNPYSLGVESDVSLLSTSIERLPGFRVSPDLPEDADDFIVGEGSADASPVIYSRTGEVVSDIEFIRNVWFASDQDVYGAAFQVLSIAAAPLTLTRPSGEGAWRAYRLLPQGLPAVEQALDQVLNWMKTIQAGVDGIVEVIRAYIEFIEARILEIQAIINRLNDLIQSIAAIQVPQASGMVLVSQGTDGVLGDLVTADNKPSDSALAYGGGVVILSGGLPAVAAELLQALFGGS